MRIWPPLIWLAALALPLAWTSLPSPAVVVLWALCAVIMMIVRHPGAALFLAGLSYGCGLALLNLSSTALLQQDWSGQDLSIKAEVVAENANGLFLLDIFEVQGRPMARPMRARLGWYAKETRPAPGQQLAALVRLKPVTALANPGSQPLARQAARERLQAYGYVKKVLAADGRPGARWRWHNWLAARLAHYDQGGLLLALLSGERGAMTDDQKQLLRETGTAHLLAISGLHVSLVAGFGALLGQGLWWLCWRRGNGQGLALSLGLLLAGLYAWQAGFMPPAQRAWLGLGLVLLLAWRRRTGRPLVLLCYLAALLASWDPLQLLDSRFWLSFSAVAVILLALWRFPGRGWRSLLWIQLALSLLLLPLQWWLFGAYPPLALPANLLAVPLVSLLVLPLTLLGLLVPPLWQLADALLSLLLWCLARLAWLGDSPWLLLLPALALWLAPLPRLSRFKLLAAALLLGLGLLRQGSELWLLDVGQGTALALRQDDRVLLYDAGPGPWSLEGLRGLGWQQRLEALVISHGDRDHAGGLAALDTEPLSLFLAGQPTPGASPCSAGQQHRWQDWRLTSLWPPAGFKGSDNNQSCVLLLEKGVRLLLPGDMEAQVEAARRWPQVDLLLVPHHGSLSSSSGAFIEQARPRVALISAGRHNPFGFPRQAVVSRYLARGIQVLDTARDGAIHCRLAPELRCRGLAPELPWWHPLARYRWPRQGGGARISPQFSDD
ncbi:DNA internalization-related competence protein ComEC/Rec2 [Gallaecimonas sp. GXIMD4217]|uniref:DNA internalization-related competence protein ComEC/Rec2 n=1 Tax=Gallaecimonas sp. GXIMD4217 TaxID=3131927 RepID=UPI00311ACEB7